MGVSASLLPPAGGTASIASPVGVVAMVSKCETRVGTLEPSSGFVDTGVLGLAAQASVVLRATLSEAGCCTAGMGLCARRDLPVGGTASALASALAVADSVERLCLRLAPGVLPRALTWITTSSSLSAGDESSLFMLMGASGVLEPLPSLLRSTLRAALRGAFCGVGEWRSSMPPVMGLGAKGRDQPAPVCSAAASTARSGLELSPPPSPSRFSPPRSMRSSRLRCCAMAPPGSSPRAAMSPTGSAPCLRPASVRARGAPERPRAPGPHEIPRLRSLAPPRPAPAPPTPPSPPPAVPARRARCGARARARAPACSLTTQAWQRSERSFQNNGNFRFDVLCPCIEFPRPSPIVSGFPCILRSQTLRRPVAHASDDQNLNPNPNRRADRPFVVAWAGRLAPPRPARFGVYSSGFAIRPHMRTAACPCSGSGSGSAWERTMI